MIPEKDMYLVMGVLLTVISVAILIAIARKPEDSRGVYLPVVVLTLAPAPFFLLMSEGILLYEQETGQSIFLGRMAAYIITWTIMPPYIGWIGGLPRRKILTLGVLISISPISTVFRWTPWELVTTVSLLVSTLGIATVAYLLFGPYGELASQQTGERKLLFAKLRNYLALIWAVYFIASALGPAQLGWFDLFTVNFLLTYLDLGTYLAFALIVIRSDKAMGQLSAQYHGDTDGESPGKSGPWFLNLV